MTHPIFWIASFTSGLFSYRRLMTYLRYMQQDEYHPGRFAVWLWRSRCFDRRATAVALASALLSLYYPFWSALIGSAACAWLGASEPDPREVGKLKLQMTGRARRTLTAAFILYLLPALASCFLLPIGPAQWLLQAGLFQLLPLCLMGGWAVLQPYESYLQRHYLRQARLLWQQVSPWTVGITGSYGKTSAKQLLGAIIEGSLGACFWPSEGVNTLMGITRQIRQRLRQGHRYGVIEMAAYRLGSIKQICALTPPQAGWITCIGVAHLERFGSQEAIYQAKSELAAAVPNEGILVCNGDDPGARRLASEFPKATTLLYGLDAVDAECRIFEWSSMASGCEFKLSWKGKIYEGFTPQLGRAALSNIAGAFAMACAMGSDPEWVLAIIRTLEPVDNRLKLAHSTGGVSYLQDAYNSNPLGFAAALEVLACYPAKRRILISPGMIELGAEQERENRRLAAIAGGICQHAIIVGPLNRYAMVEGLKEGGMTLEQISLCETREQAFVLLREISQEGDLVLIENDLPDLYEQLPSL